MASVFVLLEAFNRKEAAALGFFPCATASSANRWKILYSMFHDCPHLLLRIVQIGVFVDRFG